MKKYLLVFSLGILAIALCVVLFLGNKAPTNNPTAPLPVVATNADRLSALSQNKEQKKPISKNDAAFERVNIPEYIVEMLSLTRPEHIEMEKIITKLRLDALDVVAQHTTCEYVSNNTVGLAIGLPQPVLGSLYETTFRTLREYLGASRYDNAMTEQMKDVIAGETLYYALQRGTLVISMNGQSVDDLKSIIVNRSLLMPDGRKINDVIGFTQDAEKQFKYTFGAVAECALTNWENTRREGHGL